MRAEGTLHTKAKLSPFSVCRTRAPGHPDQASWAGRAGRPASLLRFPSLIPSLEVEEEAEEDPAHPPTLLFHFPFPSFA